MEISSSCTTSLHLSDLAELPDESKLILATEYHSKYRKEVKAVASPIHLPSPRPVGMVGMFNNSPQAVDVAKRARTAGEHFGDNIKEGISLNPEFLVLAVKAERSISDVSDDIIQSHVSSILSQASQLNLTI